MVNDYKDAAHDHRYGGTILIDGREVAETAMCCHCGGHFLLKRRHGNLCTGGWCMRCAGFICGAKCADACVPLEMQLEIMEGKLRLDALPVSVSVPRSV